jgi:hypothetical protein
MDRLLELGGFGTDRPIGIGRSWLINHTPVGKYKRGVIFSWLDRRKVLVNPALLFEFIGLSDADDEVIHKCAERWGSLGLPQDGRARRGRIVRVRPSDPEKCRKLFSYRESFASWRMMARHYRALLRLAAAINLGNQGDDDDWRVLNYKGVPSDSLHAKRLHIQGAMNMEIAVSGLTPQLVWSEDDQEWRTTLAFGCVKLSEVLAYQAMIAIADPNGCAICSGCGQVYYLDRKPNRKRRNFCQRKQCRERTAWRLSKRKQRAKKAHEGLQGSTMNGLHSWALASDQVPTPVAT